MRITKLLGGILILVCLLFIINNPMGREESPQIESSVVLRLSETKGADYPSNRGVQIFAAEVEKRSNGRIIIEIVDEGGLGSEKEVIEQVQFGGIDLARVSLLTMVEYKKELEVICQPYTFINEAHKDKVMYGDFGQEILDSLIDEGFYGLTWYEGAARGICTTDFLVTELEQLDDLTLGVDEGQLMIDYVSSLGALAITTDRYEEYQMLENNQIHGMETNLVDYYQSGNYEVAPYFTFEPYLTIPELLVASRDSMNLLSPADQELIVEAAKESLKVELGSVKAAEQRIVLSLYEKGLDVSSFVQEDTYVLYDQLMEKRAGMEESSVLLKKIQEIGEMIDE